MRPTPPFLTFTRDKWRHMARPPASFGKVLVLLGGTSAEREISLLSGENVVQALRSRGHEVLPFDPAGLDWETESLPDCNVVFIALHGTFGEDGQLQRLLEQRGLPYTGSDAEASRKAFHKLTAKTCFTQNRVRTPEWAPFTGQESREEMQAQANALGYPLFVKPEAQGSSIGVSLVQTPKELPAAVELALQYDHQGLMETAITGTEWTVALMDDLVFRPLSVKTSQGFYTYEAKYADQTTQVDFDEQLSETLEQELQSQARRAYQSLNCSGLARVDLILDQPGQAWVLEVNTIPGLTSRSCAPRAAAHHGWNLGELCETLCTAALLKKP